MGNKAEIKDSVVLNIQSQILSQLMLTERHKVKGCQEKRPIVLHRKFKEMTTNQSYAEAISWAYKV
ncbi:MAG TPA: hypothetical protein PKK91_03425 [bacterium]|nr:hypothetical protein [bacterium]HQL65074.1 hypothetical protein [bacterium]